MTINKTKLKKIIKEEAQKYLKEYDDYAYDIANDSDWQESQRYEEEETKKVWNTLSRAVQRKVKKNANDWKKRDELYMKLTAALDKIDDAQDNSYYADMIIEMAREGKFTSDVSDLDDESPDAATKKAHRMSQQRRYARKTAPVPPRLGMVESKISLEKIIKEEVKRVLCEDPHNQLPTKVGRPLRKKLVNHETVEVEYDYKPRSYFGDDDWAHAEQGNTEDGWTVAELPGDGWYITRSHFFNYDRTTYGPYSSKEEAIADVQNLT